MKRIENPHVDRDGDLAGPRGELLGHIHACCPKAGVTFQCPICTTVTTHRWRDVDEAQRGHEEPGTTTVALPPCPTCKARSFLNHTDEDYPEDLPHHHTCKAVREFVKARGYGTALNRSPIRHRDRAKG